MRSNRRASSSTGWSAKAWRERLAHSTRTPGRTAAYASAVASRPPRPRAWSLAIPRRTVGAAVTARRLAHDQGPEGPLGDVQPGLDLRFGPAPDRVLVLDRQHALEAALIEGVDHPAPVDLTQPRHPVAPPAHIPGIRPLHRPPRPAVAVTAVGEQLDVLGLGMGDPVHIRPQRGHRVDPHPDQMRGVIVQVQAK